MYKIATIIDELTGVGLSGDACVFYITPLNYKLILKYCKPDILLVESSWKGWQGSWQYRIAAYPEHPNRNNQYLINVVEYAKNLGVPTVFWNKEDGVHFDRFIKSAEHFDYIYTVDINSVPKYKKLVGSKQYVDVLPFPVQSRTHYPYPNRQNIRRCSFVGSYSTHIHPERRHKQLMLFNAAQNYGLDIYDRNSDRKNSCYRFPILSKNTRIYKKISSYETAKIYNQYLVNLNVNTIEDSQTMFSRRLVEIIACEAMAISTPAKSIEHYFSDYCYSVSTTEEAQDHIDRICRDGLSKQEKEMLKAGCSFVHQKFSYQNFIEIIMKNLTQIKSDNMILKELVR